MVNILHLYPNLMNLYGDYANVVALRKHLEDQGEKVIVDKKDIEESINFSKYDFIYMGSGSESNLMIALENIMKYEDDIKKCINDNKTILFTGNSMELLGKSIDDIDALGIFDFKSTHTNKRFVGDVIVKNKECGYVVGFINKSSEITDEDKSRLFDFVMADNGLKENNNEGYTTNNVYATQLIGPILVKNPDFMNLIIKAILGNDYDYKDIRYSHEIESYLVTLKALKERI